MTPSVTPNPAPAQVAVEPQQTQPLRSTTSETQVSNASQVNQPQGQAPARNVTNTVTNAPQTNIAQTTQNGQNQTTTPQSQQASAKTQGVGGQNQPSQVSQPSATASNPNPQQQHPLASRIFGAAQVLAGGPRYRTSIDPVTGATSRTQVPISGKQLGMAIALEALSGALSGFAKRGPNAEGQAGEAGFQSGQQIGQQRQQADEQQAQQAQADFQRSYQSAHANLQMLQLARSVGKADYDDHQQLIADNAPMLASIRDNMPQAIVAEGVSEQDAQDVKKYPLNQFLRVPTGTVPRLGADGQQVYTTSTGRIVPEGTPGSFPAWNNTYALIRSNVKTGLSGPNGQPAAWVTNGVRWGLISPDALKASANASIPISQAVTIQHESSALDQAQNDLNNFSSALKTPNVSLVQAIDANPSLRGALQSFTSRLNATGHNYQLAVADLAKTDPDSAAAIVNLYGGSNNLKAFDQQQAQADADRQPISTLAQAEGIATDPNASAQRKAQAQSFLKVHQRDAANEAYADASARAAATVRAQNAASGNGTGPTDVQRAADAVASGTATFDQLTRGMGRNAANFRREVEGTILRDHPNVNLANLQSYAKDADNVSVQAQLQNARSLFGTGGQPGAFDNLEAAIRAVPKVSIPMLSKLGQGTAYQLGSPQMATLMAIKTDVASDLARFNTGAGGRGSDHQLDLYREQLNEAQTPEQVEAVLRDIRQISTNRMTGVIGQNPYLRSMSADINSPTTRKPIGATMTVPGSDGKMHYSDGHRDLGVVPQ